VQQSHQASDVVKQQGGRNDLLERVKKTEFFKVGAEMNRQMRCTAS